jgi:hypothetical protein
VFDAGAKWLVISGVGFEQGECGIDVVHIARVKR